MITYKDAGVDVERGYEAVKLMKDHAKSTFDKNVLGGLGAFGGFYSIADFITPDPVLVSGTDGVGTKLKIAFLMDKHDTVGLDCVAMCADDVVCQGAKPLFFLDYLATGRLDPQKAADIVKGIAEGCKQAGCALIGGETAEMPGFYPDGEYDLAGFCVGIADRSSVINGSAISSGDVLIGLASSGLHSNGYSLVRKLLIKNDGDVNKYSAELGKTIGEELLTPTRIYAGNILKLIKQIPIKGISHITGGGFIENLPRIFPEGVGCFVSRGAWEVQPIFEMLKKLGGMDDFSAYGTFNMGIGMVLCVSPEHADAAVRAANALGEKASIIGQTIAGSGVELR
ncbi:MAG: phosphoribosylformylglycinamidine cyclo-ligase [Christensenellales bacterium]|jgi:phosphoribosylformylglycinamidine cyclo-ligase